MADHIKMLLRFILKGEPARSSRHGSPPGSPGSGADSDDMTSHQKKRNVIDSDDDDDVAPKKKRRVTSKDSDDDDIDDDDVSCRKQSGVGTQAHDRYSRCIFRQPVWEFIPVSTQTEMIKGFEFLKMEVGELKQNKGLVLFLVLKNLNIISNWQLC